MTIDMLITEIKKVTFKRKHLGMKRKFRFLEDSEILESGDLHVIVDGFGFTKYESQKYMLELLGELTNEPKHTQTVIDFLKENPQYYAQGRKAIIIARIADNDYAGQFYEVQGPGCPVSDYPNRVFIRPYF